MTNTQETIALPEFPDGSCTHFDPERYGDFLGVIQGNILQGHGREHARLVFFRFEENSPQPAKRDLLRAAEREWVVSARAQREQAKLFRAAGPRSAARLTASRQLFCGFTLTLEGLKALGVTTEVGNFPFFETPGGKTPSGQIAVGHLERLHRMRNDMDLVDEAATEHWGPPFTESPHGLWILAADHEAALDEAVNTLTDWCRLREARIIAPIENGIRWRDRKGNSREPFGFVDGISMPVFYTDQRNGESSPWIEMTLDEVILPKTLPGAAGVAGGSYLSVLKIEQHVGTFRTYERTVSDLLSKAKVRGARSLAAGLLMGRLRDGRPLAEALDRDGTEPGDLNLFDFQDDPKFSRCPFHAHIRKMNPRSTEVPGGKNRVVATQIVRRSMIFDDRRQLKNRLAGDPWPDSGVGLLFMAYMTNTSTQFGTLHNDWAIDGDFPPPAPAGQAEQRDSVLYGSDGIGWTWRGHSFPPAPRFITRLGGDYLFVPSLAWMKNGGG